jgi:hypothetical protein
MANYTTNNGMSPLKDATVSFLAGLDIENLTPNAPCFRDDTTDICYETKTVNDVRGVYTTGRCLIEIIGSTSPQPCCPSDCATFVPFVQTVDLALFVDNIFNGVDAQFSNTVSSLVTAVNGIGGLTVEDISANTDTFFVNAGVSPVSSLPTFRTVVEETHANNSNMSVDLSVLKALFGIHA